MSECSSEEAAYHAAEAAKISASPTASSRSAEMSECSSEEAAYHAAEAAKIVACEDADAAWDAYYACMMSKMMAALANKAAAEVEKETVQRLAAVARLTFEHLPLVVAAQFQPPPELALTVWARSRDPQQAAADMKIVLLYARAMATAA